MCLIFLATLSMTLCVCSCSSDEENDEIPAPPQEEEAAPSPKFSATTNVPAGYDFGIVNENNGSTYLVANSADNSSGAIDRISFELSGDNSNLTKSDGSTVVGTVIFFNSIIRSITINGVTYTFAVNDDGQIDAAVVCNGISELYTNVASAELLGASFTGDDFAAILSDAFSKIGNGTNIIIAINQLIISDSALYSEIQAIINYILGLQNDASDLGDTETTGELVETPTEEPTDVDEDRLTGSDETADDNTNKGNGAIVSGKGALKVTLTWFYQADIDLHIYEPGYASDIPGYTSNIGHICYWAKNNSFTDGFLDIDNMRGFYINPETGEANESLAAVENVYWPESPKDGVYNIYLDYFSGSETGPCNVTVYVDGRSIYDENITMLRTDRQKHIISVKMPEGTIQTTAQTRAGENFSIMDYRLFPAK